VHCEYSTRPSESRPVAIKRRHDELQEQVADHEELYRVLKSRPLKEAHAILDRIRSGNDLQATLQYVKHGDLLLQVGLAPESRYRYELPRLWSARRAFFDPHDPYQQSPILELQYARSSEKCRTATTPIASNIYEMPYHTAQFIDPRMAKIKASRWTAVTTDDVLVTKLIGIYFQFQYPLNIFFQKDLFLNDMLRGKSRFCSSLLVNTILAAASVSAPRH
jgi:hypothetical protein